ncbi:hydrogenase maturation nickel metallochaperone HypA [Candidatus Woesearchaeota archaeon]|nr:hydrogenase maturation nickel metallochaperone HypA [Candidatus Woesearchaeota archaeon]
MHETVIAKGIIKEAMKHGSPEEINLEIGELAHVPAYELAGCLKQLVDWKITYTEQVAFVSCDCGFSGHPTVLERGHDSFLIECPECGSVPKLLAGTEIKIVSVKVK